MKKYLPSCPPNLFTLNLKTYTILMIYFFGSLGLVSAQNDNANQNGHDNSHENATVYGGDIAFIDGSSYTSVCVGDDEPDFVEAIVENASGRVKQWIITDYEGNILGLPDDPSDVNFDGAGVGICYFYHLSYNGIKPLVDPSGQEKFTKNIIDIVGKYHLSEPIIVERFLQPTSGVLEGGPFEFCVGDGVADNISEGAISLSGNSSTNKAWVVTDSEGVILGLPAMPSAVDFDGAGAGVCLIWHLGYEDNVTVEVGMNANNLMGCYALSNPITVNRYLQPTPGVLEGGPFEFCVGDGVADNISEGAISLSANSSTNKAWVVTDSEGVILGLPPMPSAVDFDGAGAGVCLIWHLGYEDNVTVEVGMNANNLMGCYALSNPITVNRYLQPTPGVLEGGPFEFCVGDGVADNISEGAISLSANSSTNEAWVVTDSDRNILGLPESPYAVNFDGAGNGICLIWHLGYEDNVSFEGVTNADQLIGCFALSNPITVNRNEVAGGIITGGTENSFSFTVGDGTADNITEGAITLTGNVGANSAWVVTDDAANPKILGLPTNYWDVNFDGAGAGNCKIWHISYQEGLKGLTASTEETTYLVSALEGCFELSNAITVVRTAASSGKVAVFPNPSKGTVYINYYGFTSDKVTISIFNISNYLISNQDFRSLDKKTVLDISSFDSGIYFVKVTDQISGETEIKRLIVD